MAATEPNQLSPGGVFPNGIHATTVVQLIVDYDEAAPIRDVAAYFDLTVEDVAAALGWWASEILGVRAERRSLD